MSVGIAMETTSFAYPYNVYMENCPTRMVLDRIADKWAVLLLIRLEDGPVRFNQLKRDIEGLSQKVLSQTLKRLERDGLITRTAYPTVPVTVEYAMTPLGQTLRETVSHVRDWAETHIEAVLAAQAAYDTNAKSTP
jgi:DNA-binding HxlR family transcriptional regulator